MSPSINLIPLRILWVAGEINAMHRKKYFACVCRKSFKKKEECWGEWSGVYINLTFNALRTRMCKRLSLLAINSYLSWCGKRKRRHLPQPCLALPCLAPLLHLSLSLSLPLLLSLFSILFCLCVSENVCKTLDLRKDKIMLCKTIKWHYLWPADPCACPCPWSCSTTATQPMPNAKWCVSIRNCCSELCLKGLFMNPTNGPAASG